MSIQKFEEILTPQQIKEKIAALQSVLNQNLVNHMVVEYTTNKIAALQAQLKELEKTIPQHDNEDWLAYQEAYELNHK